MGSFLRKSVMAVLVVVVGVLVVRKDRIMRLLRRTTPVATEEPVAQTLPPLRRALKTTVGEGQSDATPAPDPPSGVFEKVSYDAPLGKNVAYVTPVAPGPRRPGIVWIHGGFSWGIDALAWEDAARDNDQSAIAFRKAGIALMFPSLRGENGNPGHRECFLGEVDDVLAAVDFLAQRPDVDPKRVYLGGHSTGGVMVLLAAASTTKLRAAFAFGPVAEPRQYGKSSCLPPGLSDAEVLPRSAIEHLHEIASPTFIIEGSQGNAAVFPMMKRRTGSAPITFVEVPGASHFNVLAPGCDVVAKAILADTGPTPSIHIDAAQIRAAY